MRQLLIWHLRRPGAGCWVVRNQPLLSGLSCEDPVGCLESHVVDNVASADTNSSTLQPWRVDRGVTSPFVARLPSCHLSSLSRLSNFSEACRS